MISLKSIPDRITNGQTLKVKLTIEGKINISTYKNLYFNLTIRKNGGTHGTITLYPLKFVGCELEWEVNQNSYKSDGTFNVSCTLQNGPLISSTTFLIEPDSLVKNANKSSNITLLEQRKRLLESQVKKKIIEPEYVKSFQVQKPEIMKNAPEINFKENLIENNKLNNEFNKNLISTAKVQKHRVNC